MTLFDQLLVNLSNQNDRFEVCRGIAFGHRMIKMNLPYTKNDKRIIELNDNEVAINSDNFNNTYKSFEEASRAFRSIS